MRHKIIILLLFLFAFGLRLYGLNWDQGHHLHPDERFLSMVGSDIKVTKDMFSYLDPNKSTLNPYNMGYKFFVYGSFPVTLNKILVVLFNHDNYDSYTYYGRILSALFDSLTAVVIYLICLLWERKKILRHEVKYLATFFYSIAVLPIQLSHFFTVDTFLSFFMLLSFYFSLRYLYVGNIKNIIFSGTALGLAMGSKISAVFILPLILFNISIFLLKKRNFYKIIINFILICLFSYLSLRIADPKVFIDSNLLAPYINTNFINNLKELSSLSNQNSWFPPAVQWINKFPIWFSFYNLVLFGLGIPYFFFLVLGVINLIKKRDVFQIIIFLWVIIFFIYQSTNFIKSMRYFFFIYPFLAIWSGEGLGYLIRTKIKGNKLFLVIILLILMLWPFSFMHIYSKKHSRVEASYWINNNIKDNSVLAEEHWDDPLPLLISDITNKQYEVIQMPVFNRDDKDKWDEINKVLEKADYYIITSNRAYGSIMEAKDMYPEMSIFYKKLFNGETNFKLIKIISSYPSINLGLIKLEFNDDFAEEAFTVYDHPKVLIFKKI